MYEHVNDTETDTPRISTRTFVKIGAAVVGAIFLGLVPKDKDVIAFWNGYASTLVAGKEAHQIIDPYVLEIESGYRIIGPKKAPGVLIDKTPNPRHNALFDDGIVEIGDTADLSTIVSEDGETGFVYLNDAALKSPFGEEYDGFFAYLVYDLYPETWLGGWHSREGVKEVAEGLYRFEIDLGKIKNTEHNIGMDGKYNPKKPMAVFVSSEPIRQTNTIFDPHVEASYFFD